MTGSELIPRALENDMKIKRWTPRRKAELVEKIRAVPDRKLALLAEHQISSEEFAAWERDFDANGMLALRATRLQQYHRERRPQSRF